MRQIGTLPSDADARRFVDYLRTQNVPARANGGDGQWQIWVLDENHIAQAKGELAAFVADPRSQRYTDAGRAAATVRAADERRQQTAAKSVIQMRDRWQQPRGVLRPLTVLLILACVVVSLFTDLGESPGQLGALLRISPAPAEHGTLTGLDAIRAGEAWRLVTPIFLHFGIFHLVFNVWWLADLGGMIEARRGAWLLLALTLALAIPSNLAQYFHTGPNFGGMSGVNYGLFGYIWMQSRYNPASRMWIHPNSVALMVIWFAICLTGKAGPVANTVHTVGLALGLVLGLAPLLWQRRGG